MKIAIIGAWCAWAFVWGFGGSWYFIIEGDTPKGEDAFHKKVFWFLTNSPIIGVITVATWLTDLWLIFLLFDWMAHF